MKKIILMVLVIAVLCNIVNALSVTQTLKVYVDDTRDDDVSESGGLINTIPGNIVEIQDKIQDNSNESVRVKITLSMELISDKVVDWFTVPSNAYVTKVLTFTIPNDADRDVYDMSIRHEYVSLVNSSNTWNTTTYYSLKVVTPNVVEGDSFGNLTKTCNNMITNLSGCWGYVEAYKLKNDDLLSCINREHNYDNDNRTCGANLINTISNQQRCENEKNISTSELNQCRADLGLLNERLSNMVDKNTCEQEKQDARTTEAKGYKNIFTFLVFAAIVGAVIYYMRKQGGSVVGTYNQNIPYNR